MCVCVCSSLIIPYLYEPVLTQLGAAEKEMSGVSLTSANQPYNVILAGSFGVGKSSLFNKLSGEVHADYHFNSVAVSKDTCRSPSQQFGKWTHTALVNGDTVKVQI